MQSWIGCMYVFDICVYVFVNVSRIPPRLERRPAHNGQLTDEAVGGALECIGQ